MKRVARLLAKLPDALSREHLDLTISLQAGLDTRIVERPGLTLGEDELADLTQKLREVASHTLPSGSLTYGVFSGERERLSNVVVTLISDAATGRPIGFNALALMDVTIDGEPRVVTHLGLVMVDRDERSRGLSSTLYGLTTLLLFARGGLRPFWVSNVTQVPAVVGMVSETFSNVFPAPEASARQSFAHLSLARQIMRRHRHVFGVGDEAQFDETRSVILDAYTGGSDDLKKTFDQAPKHRDARYNDYCRNLLDYGRGDDVLQLARMDLATARRYLVAHIPPRSLPALALTATFLMLQRLALPIVHWFDDSKRFGALRPSQKAVTK